MKKRTINPIIYIIMCVLLSACSGGKQNSFLHKVGGDTLKLRYAENLIIVKYKDYSEVTVLNPWKKGEVLGRYVLTANADSMKREGIDDKAIVQTPLSRLLVGTAVHCALFEELDSKDAVAGVCESEYINLKFVKEGVASGTIADCGSGMQPNTERVIAMSPDAIFLSPYENSAGYGKVLQLGIPIIEVADYMEKSPLGRSEWMIFYGMLVGKEAEAREIFYDVERKYNEYKTMAAQQETHPKVMMDKMVQATWFLPGGRSTIGQILADAHCNYVYADTKVSGSVEQSFEQVLQKGVDADIWLMRYNMGDNTTFSLADLSKENSKYKLFEAFKKGNVYACDPSSTGFFEQTPFHPERLLRDFLLIVHPNVTLDNKATIFFKKLGV